MGKAFPQLQTLQDFNSSCKNDGRITIFLIVCVTSSVSVPEIDFTSARGDAEVADRHTRRGQPGPLRDPREQSRG